MPRIGARIGAGRVPGECRGTSPSAGPPKVDATFSRCQPLEVVSRLEVGGVRWAEGAWDKVQEPHIEGTAVRPVLSSLHGARRRHHGGLTASRLLGPLSDPPASFPFKKNTVKPVENPLQK